MADGWRKHRVRDDGTVEGCVIETYIRFPESATCPSEGELKGQYVDFHVDEGPYNVCVRMPADQLRAMVAELDRLTGGVERIIKQDVIARLNELARLDPEALSQLVNTRVPCNTALAVHPAAPVHVDDDHNVTIGLLGVLNGLFAPTGGAAGCIAVVIAKNQDDKVRACEFRILESQVRE